MIVDHRHKYIYVAVPKTGSISIQFSLGHSDIPEPPLYHQGIQQILDDNPDCRGYYKFSFVRNPWDRLHSLYQDFTKKRINQYSALVKHDKPLFGEFADFEAFCVGLADSEWANDIFLQSQARLLDEHNHTLDYIGRFEHLEKDYNKVCEIIGLRDTPLQLHNKGVYDGSYKDHYTPKAIDAIARLYADDIDLFGYEF